MAAIEGPERTFWVLLSIESSCFYPPISQISISSVLVVIYSIVIRE